MSPVSKTNFRSVSNRMDNKVELEHEDHPGHPFIRKLLVLLLVGHEPDIQGNCNYNEGNFEVLK